MRFLWSGGGEIDRRFAGVLTTPAHKGIPAAILSGAPWAADNQAFTKGFTPDPFFDWLNGKMRAYFTTCLFVAVPDAVGNARKTNELFSQWRPFFGDWPTALVAQDGQENLDFPAGEWAALFVGGTTRWKESTAAIETIKRAQALGKRVHIGRVNWGRRYDLFKQIQGSQEFTCDGTRQRFEGAERTSNAWLGYHDRQTLQIW